MPYFERLPYAEMIARAVEGNLSANRSQSSVVPPAVKSPILEQATRILREESAGLPSSSRSRLNLPFAATASDGQSAFLSTSGNDKEGPDGVLLLDPPPPVKAGQTATVVLSMANDSEASMSLCLVATHLVSCSGARIAASNIDISPEETVVAPAQSVDVKIDVDVPDIIIPGEYAGLLQVFGNQTARAVVVINVVK